MSISKSLTRIKNIIYIGVKTIQEPYYQGFAAQIAFYFMLSIIPLVILLSYVLSLFELSMDLIYDLIGDYLQGDTADYLIGMLTSHNSGGGLTIALIASALYGASKASYSLSCIANHMSVNSEGKGFLIERVRAVFNILITIATITGALIFLVYGETLLRMTVGIVANSFLPGDVAENVTRMMESTMAQLFLHLRWPIMFILFALVLSFNYFMLPTKRVEFSKVLPGGIFAAAGVIVMTLLFSYYMGHISTYNLLYGSAASLVALMVWFYLISWVLVLGLLLNEALLETKGVSEAPHTKDMVKELTGLDVESIKIESIKENIDNIIKKEKDE